MFIAKVIAWILLIVYLLLINSIAEWLDLPWIFLFIPATIIILIILNIKGVDTTPDEWKHL